MVGYNYHLNPFKTYTTPFNSEGEGVNPNDHLHNTI